MLRFLLVLVCLLPGISAAADSLLIKNIRLIAMTGPEAEVLPGHSVWIGQGVIRGIGPDSQFSAVPGAEVIDGQGQYLLPGLIDVHVHVWDKAELPAYLAYGVTAVRNASGMPFHLDYARAISAGELTGPFLLTTGPILNSPGPNQQANHKLVITADEAVAAVRDQYQQGFRHIKVYSNLSRAAYEAILAEAAELGMTVMGHSPEGLRDEGIPTEKPFNIAFEEILDDGLVTLEHMETIVWHGLYDALDEDRLRALAREIAAQGNAVTPTLLAHHNLAEVARTQGAYLQRPGTEMLNPFIAALEQPLYDFWSSQPVGSRHEQDVFYQQATRMMQEEGVMLLAGSDAGIFTNIPGESLLDELDLMVAGGLTPFQAIQTATANAGWRLPLEGRGVIRAGHPADLILVENNPLDDVRALRTLSGVVAQGHWYDRDGLAELRAQASQTSVERTQTQLMEGLASQGTTLE